MGQWVNRSIRQKIKEKKTVKMVRTQDEDRHDYTRKEGKNNTCACRQVQQQCDYDLKRLIKM